MPWVLDRCGSSGCRSAERTQNQSGARKRSFSTIRSRIKIISSRYQGCSHPPNRRRSRLIHRALQVFTYLWILHCMIKHVYYQIHIPGQSGPCTHVRAALQDLTSPSPPPTEFLLPFHLSLSRLSSRTLHVQACFLPHRLKPRYCPPLRLLSMERSLRGIRQLNGTCYSSSSALLSFWTRSTTLHSFLQSPRWSST